MKYFGLFPQFEYAENILGWNDNAHRAETIRPEQWWAAHKDASSGIPAWLQSNFADLQHAWGGLTAAERQSFLDVMLKGAGLPEYTMGMLRARPQWINDYIASTFKV